MNFRLIGLCALVALPLTVLADEKDGTWKGGIESSITFINANRSSESILLAGRARSIREMDRIFIDGYYSYSKTKTGLGPFTISTDQWSLGGRYERDFGNNSFWYVNAGLDRDGVNMLNLRTQAGAGLGYTVFDHEDSSLRFRIGASWVNEEFQTVTNAFWGLSMGTEYEQQLSEDLYLTHGLVYIPNVEQFSDYYLNSNFGLSYSINESLSAGFRWIVSYDSQPPAGSLRQSTTYAFVLGYKF